MIDTPFVYNRFVTGANFLSRKQERDTLTNLLKQNEHILIIGGDNIRIIEKWHKWDELLHEFEVWVYPRGGIDDSQLCEQYDSMPKTKKVRYLSNAPLYNISSTEIRNSTRKAGDGQ